MAKHNMHMLTTLTQLKHDMKELLTKLTKVQNKLTLLPNQLPPSKSHGTLPMHLFQDPNLTQKQALFSLLISKNNVLSLVPHTRKHLIKYTLLPP